MERKKEEETNLCAVDLHAIFTSLGSRQTSIPSFGSRTEKFGNHWYTVYPKVKEQTL